MTENINVMENISASLRQWQLKDPFQRMKKNNNEINGKI